METKSGYKTTEFWVVAGVAATGFAAAIGVISPDQTEVLKEALPQAGGLVSDVITRAMGLIAMVGSAFGYAKSRGDAKKG